jgi:hypothetical protein
MDDWKPDENVVQMMKERGDVIEWLSCRDTPFSAYKFKTDLNMSGSTSKKWLLTLVTHGCISTVAQGESVIYKVNFTKLETWQ